MRLTACKVKFVWLLLTAVLCGSFFASSVFADDDSKPGASGTEQPSKLETPKPGLTERERWLLDKVEQLERRVAEVESKTALPVEAGPPASPADPSAGGAAGPTAGAISSKAIFSASPVTPTSSTESLAPNTASLPPAS
jgi:hypothetical protein